MRIGDKGEQVRLLQEKLNAAGAKPKLNADGHFGAKTKAAVVAFQRRNSISAIGVAGPRTMAALNGLTDPKAVSSEDYCRAAAELGVSIAAVAAVAEVESAGRGFLSDGRPVILYERHIFYRQASTKSPQQADVWASKYPSVCNRRAGGYIGGSAEHQRLSTAKQLDVTWAQESCSWGMFQIMGFHWQLLGYRSVAEMVESMSRGEGEQLDALVRFIKADKRLHQAMKAGRWAAFARIYNGPAYKENLYDTKLARAFEHFEAVYGKDEKAAA